MKHLSIRQNRDPLVPAQLVGVLLLSVLLVGCGRAASATTVEPTPPPVALLTPSPPPPSPVRPDRGATKIAEVATEMAAQAIAGAHYTPVVPLTPEVMPTSIPALTPILGFPEECGDASRVFDTGGCYNTRINNEYIFVQVGGHPNDPSQGLLRVYTSTLDQFTRSPWQEYPTPRQEGFLYVAQFNGEQVTVIALHDHAPTTTLVFNLITRTWTGPSTCQLYPVALHRSSVQSLPPRLGVVELANGRSAGNFGWLAWRADLSDGALASSLTAPGDSSTYINPNNPADHSISVGDWVTGRTTVSNSVAVDAALTRLAKSYFRVVVPIWDQVTDQGGHLQYQVSSFAWIQIVASDLSDPHHLSMRYWGPATCSENP